VAFSCADNTLPPQALAPWTRRDLSHKGDVRLPDCADRKGRRVKLKECGEQAEVRSDGLGVPPRATVQLEVDAEAGAMPASYWVELVEKRRKDRRPRALRPREEVTLKAGERRTVKLDVELPEGSPSVEAWLGLASKKDELTLHRLRVFHGSAPAPTEPAPQQLQSDAGD
jgi:hypothetical protein